MIRRILLAAVLGASLTNVAPVTPAQAAESCGVVYYCLTNYYASASYETVVGQRIVDCDGVESRWGTVTVWRQVSSYACDL